MVSCGVRWSEVGLSEFRKPQVVGPVLIGGSTPHFVKIWDCLTLHDSVSRDAKVGPKLI